MSEYLDYLREAEAAQQQKVARAIDEVRADLTGVAVVMRTGRRFRAGRADEIRRSAAVVVEAVRILEACTLARISRERVEREKRAAS